MDQCLNPSAFSVLSLIVELREEMDGKSGMERLAGSECELDDSWYCKDDKRGRVKGRHVSCDCDCSLIILFIFL